MTQSMLKVKMLKMMTKSDDEKVWMIECETGRECAMILKCEEVMMLKSLMMMGQKSTMIFYKIPCHHKRQSRFLTFQMWTMTMVEV
jgi:hypothetical protein